MMHKRSLPLVMLFILLTLSGCSSKDAISPDISIPVILFQAGDDSCNYLSGIWDTMAEEFIIDEEPFATVNQELFYHITSWHGNDELLLPPNFKEYSVNDSKFSLNKISREELEKQTFIGDGLFVEFGADGVFQASIEDGARTLSGAISHVYNVNGQTLSVWEECNIVSIGYYQNILYITFSYYGESEFLCTVKFDSDMATETWMPVVIIPEKWWEISTFMSLNECTFIDGVVYFAMGYNLYAYEVESGVITEKTEITDKVDSLFGEFIESGQKTGFQSIALNDYVSDSGTVIIAYYPTQYKSNVLDSHLVYFLIWNDAFAGALDIHGERLFLYDSNGNQIREYDIAHLNLENIALRFPKSQSMH